MPIALYALALCAFAIGTTELVVAGVLPDIAKSLDIRLPTTGELVTLYAFGVAVGAPFLTLLTRRIPRKVLLVALLILFALGNFCSALAPGFTTLVVLRFLTGTMHGVFMAVAASIGTALVDKARQGTAIAVLFSGITVAMVLGVPLGTYVGQALDWRATFVMVGALALLSVFVVMIFVPKVAYESRPQGLRQIVRLFSAVGLDLLYLVTVFGFGAVLAIYTFIVPTLTDVSGLQPIEADGVLLLYGVAIALGNLFGGRLADKIGFLRALTILLSILVCVLLTYSYAQHLALFSVGNLILIGFFGYAITPILQASVVTFARSHLPDLVDFASSLNIASFNVGIMLGSFLAGETVRNWGLAHTPIAAAISAALALAIVGLAYRSSLPGQLTSPQRATQ